MQNSKKKLVQGIGYNDANYAVHKFQYMGFENGKSKTKRIWSCPFYVKWAGLMERCNPVKQATILHTYLGVTVCEDWKTFSKFKSWMQEQQWEGLQLDKDILIQGNKIYSPETCVFVPSYINSLLTQSDKARGEYPLGVTRDRIAPDMKNYLKNSYRASIKKVDSNKRQMKFLGLFASPEEAHKAWQLAKVERILDHIERYRLEDCYLSIVEEALLVRVNQLKSDIENNRETFKL